MKNIIRLATSAVKKKIFLWAVGLIGVSGFAIIISVLILLLIILGAVAGSANSNNTSGGGSYCAVSGDVNLESWNAVFSSAGKLSGAQDTIIELSYEKGIDPVLFAAIAIHETGYGTSNAIVNKNNPGGLMDPSTGSRVLYTFSTLDDGLRAMANTLYNRIIRDGLSTLESLGSVYAPIGAANDPTGLNKNWVPNVSSIASDLGGLTMNCEDTGLVEIIGDQAWPVPHTKNITSGYGHRTIKVQGVWQSRLHAGIDIAGGGDTGKPIVSFMAGVVTTSSFNSGWGNYVTVDHGNGMQTLYAHMVEKGVPVGTEVQAGSFVGKIGTTGNSTGPHLHFEIHINGKAVDPLPHLKGLLGAG